MREIKLNLQEIVRVTEDIKPEAGMIVEVTIDGNRVKRLIIKNHSEFIAIDLAYMRRADSDVGGNLVCLRATNNPKIIGKLTL